MKTWELLDEEILVERSRVSGASYDGAVSEIKGVKAVSPETNSSKNGKFLESACREGHSQTVLWGLEQPKFLCSQLVEQYP